MVAEPSDARGDILLARLDRTRAALAEARTLLEVGAILNDVEQLRRYAAAAKWTLDEQNAIARVWFLTQRRGGEMLTPSRPETIDRAGRGRPKTSESSTLSPARLSDLGIKRDQSSHWQLYARTPEPEFAAILDEIAEARRLTTSALLPYLEGANGSLTRPVRLAGDGGRAIVYGVDYRALLDEIDDESVDLLLTDPPYSTDVDDIASFAAEWTANAVPKVRRSGRAYICIGAYPAELRAYLDALLGRAHLPLRQVLCWTYRNTLGPAPSLDYKTNWQAILYLRGDAAPPLDCVLMAEQFSVADLAAPDGRVGTRAHPWQKPDALAERLVRHALPAEGVVLDPFAGTGTFLAAASRLGHRALGSETDPAMLAWCERRGIEVVDARA